MGSLRNLGICVALAAAGCGDKPSKEACTRLFEHVVDLEVEAGGAKAAALTPEMKEDLETQRKATTDAHLEKYVATCTSKTPKRVVECQIAAPNLEELAKCE